MFFALKFKQMKTKMENIQKRTYSSPQIERIELDNEISLALESATPPEAPGYEGGSLGSNAPDYFNNDPFKTNLM